MPASVTRDLELYLMVYYSLFPTPDGPWQSVSLDFVTDLPVCCGHGSILVVVDRCTKLAIFSACTKTISAP
jgi:hypothetical protein